MKLKMTEKILKIKRKIKKKQTKNVGNILKEWLVEAAEVILIVFIVVEGVIVGLLIDCCCDW